VRRAVVAYCHSKRPVGVRFLLRAQDHNMTNGDFAFFTFEPRSGNERVLRPWNDDAYNPEDRLRLRRAFSVVKWVSAYLSSAQLNSSLLKDGSLMAKRDTGK